MAVAYVSSGLIASAAAQTVAPAYPASIAAGDGLVLVRTAKPDTAALTTPAGWTLVDSRTGGAGVFGNDTGPLVVAIYFRQADGLESGTLTCDSTPATVDVQQAIVSRYTKGSGTWDTAGSGGADSTASTDWSVTAAGNPGITAGDVVHVALCWPTDSARTWSAEALSATGATITSLTVPIASTTTSLGADMTTRAHNFSCTTGAATGAPTYTGTVNSGINVAGPTSLIRLREVTSGVDGVLAVTLPSIAASAAGTVEVTGALTATLPAATATTVSAAETTGTLTSATPATVAELAGTVEMASQLAATLPAVTATLTSGSRTVVRPNTGIVTRPNTGTVVRP